MYQQEMNRIQKQQQELLSRHNIKQERIRSVLQWVLSIEKGQYTEQQKQHYYKTLAQKSSEYGQILNYLSLENKKLQIQKQLQLKIQRPKVPVFAECDPCWQISVESEKIEEQGKIEDMGFEEFNYSDNTTASSEQLIEQIVQQQPIQSQKQKINLNNKQSQKRFESFEQGINKVFEDLEIKDLSILEKSLEICAKIIENQSLIKGKQANIIAGAIIYLSSLILIKPIHHRKIASIIDCKEKTLLQVCDQIKAAGITQDKDISEIQIEYILNKLDNYFNQEHKQILKQQSLEYITQLHNYGLIDGEQKVTLSTYSLYKSISQYLPLNLKQIAELADMCEISLKNLDLKINKKINSLNQIPQQQPLTQVC